MYTLVQNFSTAGWTTGKECSDIRLMYCNRAFTLIKSWLICFITSLD